MFGLYHLNQLVRDPRMVHHSFVSSSSHHSREMAMLGTASIVGYHLEKYGIDFMIVDKLCGLLSLRSYRVSDT